MTLPSEDEMELIKQVVSMEVMIGQSIMMQKEMREDVKALRLEYQNYRKDMDTRLQSLEYWQRDIQHSNLRERIEAIEDDKRKLTGGWQALILGFAVGWALFGDRIKQLLNNL